MDGIIVGTDQNQEWMLKWWWEHYHSANTFPVTFIDFGMSEGAKIWCRAKGNLISLTPGPTSPAPDIASDNAKEKRDVWLTKPRALMSSPYDRTIWIDIDCLIKKDLSPLFAKCPKDHFALCPEHPDRARAEKQAKLIPENATSYNSGVILYPSNTKTLKIWAEHTEHRSSLGDQDLLNTLIHEKELPILKLPSYYNQIHPALMNKDTIIYHYASQAGKNALLEGLSLHQT